MTTMARFPQILAALALVGVAGVFAVRSWQLTKPPIPPAPSPPPMIGPPQPHFVDMLAYSLADRLSQQVVLYQYDHGKLPMAVDFWKDMSGYIDKPIHNPINGSADVVAMRSDLDAAAGGVGVRRKDGRGVPRCRVQCRRRGDATVNCCRAASIVRSVDTVSGVTVFTFLTSRVSNTPAR